MNLSRIAMIATIAMAATLMTGCQDSQCQQENAQLQGQVETLTQQVEKSAAAQQNTMKIISDLNTDNQKLRNQVTALKKAASRTPEQKAKIQKGLQELYELQRKSAEKMRKEAERLKKEAQK